MTGLEYAIVIIAESVILGVVAVCAAWYLYSTLRLSEQARAEAEDVAAHRMERQGQMVDNARREQIATLERALGIEPPDPFGTFLQQRHDELAGNHTPPSVIDRLQHVSGADPTTPGWPFPVRPDDLSAPTDDDPTDLSSPLDAIPDDYAGLPDAVAPAGASWGMDDPLPAPEPLPEGEALGRPRAMGIAPGEELIPGLPRADV